MPETRPSSTYSFLFWKDCRIELQIVNTDVSDDAIEIVFLFFFVRIFSTMKFNRILAIMAIDGFRYSKIQSSHGAFWFIMRRQVFDMNGWYSL